MQNCSNCNHPLEEHKMSGGVLYCVAKITVPNRDGMISRTGFSKITCPCQTRHIGRIRAWQTRDAELRNEAVQRYGETPVSEQPTSETDAEISEEDEAWQDEIDRQEIRDEDERIRKFRYSKRD